MPRPHFTRDAWGDALRALLEPTDGRKKPKSAKQRYWMLLGAAAEARGFACVVADDGTLGFVQPTDGNVRPSDAWVRLPGADHSKPRAVPSADRVSSGPLLVSSPQVLSAAAAPGGGSVSPSLGDLASAPLIPEPDPPPGPTTAPHGAFFVDMVAGLG